jgi:hypothetical protein
MTLPDAEVFRFCDTTEVREILGNSYLPIPCRLSDFEQVSGAGLPERTLETSGVELAELLKPLIRERGGVAGSRIVITDVIAEQPDIDMSYTAQVYDVTHSTSGPDWVVLHLGAPDLMRQPVPWDRYNARRCAFRKDFKGAECQAVTAETVCDGRFETCVGFSNEERWHAKVGLKERVTRIV